jgi:hypothetical protein
MFSYLPSFEAAVFPIVRMVSGPFAVMYVRRPTIIANKIIEDVQCRVKGKVGVPVVGVPKLAQRLSPYAS